MMHITIHQDEPHLSVEPAFCDALPPGYASYRQDCQVLLWVWSALPSCIVITTSIL